MAIFDILSNKSVSTSTAIIWWRRWPFIRLYTGSRNFRSIEDLLNNIGQGVAYDLESEWLTIQYHDHLRERRFGDFDQLPLVFYNKVWPRDMINAENSHYYVESVQQVSDRLAIVITDLENKYSDKYIVLTSHADTLQILHTLMSQEDPRYFCLHRFKNCEARLLIDDDLSSKRTALNYDGVNP